MKAYLDLGSHNGNSIQEFLESSSIFIKRNDAQYYQIWAFEPNSEYHKLNERFPNINILPVAWLYNGQVEFKNDPASLSSCVSQYTMQCYDEAYSKKETFACVDLAEFILNLNTDYLVVKMDVESAEYALIPRLIETKAIHKINELYVEFHHPGNPEYEQIKLNIMDYIKNNCAMEFFDNWP